MTVIASEVFELTVAPGPIDKARAGDQEAFAEIVERHESMVFGLAYRFFNDRPRAEEIAQDVFLQLYRNLDAIESDSHLLFWLRQVTTRRCIDVMRRARLKAVSLDDAEPLHAVPRGDADPLRDRRLRKFIAELPDVQRTVVTLRYQEDLDPAEICRIVEMPVNTVKSHLHRALQTLRRRLGEH
jgi:RNA polymerase sigma-70 factor (ECF subfamily)